jgi:hypothetical protein
MMGLRMEVGGRNMVSITIDLCLEEKEERGDSGIMKSFNFNLNSWRSKHT